MDYNTQTLPNTSGFTPPPPPKRSLGALEVGGRGRLSRLIPILILVLKRKEKNLFGGIFSRIVVLHSSKIVINLPSHIVKKNLIGSMVSEILWYRQTVTQTERHYVTFT